MPDSTAWRREAAEKMARARASLSQARQAFGTEPPDWRSHPVSWSVWMTQRVAEVVPEELREFYTFSAGVMVDERGDWHRVIATSGIDSALLKEVYSVRENGMIIAGDEANEPLDRSIHAEIRSLDLAVRTKSRFIAMGATNRSCYE